MNIYMLVENGKKNTVTKCKISSIFSHQFFLNIFFIFFLSFIYLDAPNQLWTTDKEVASLTRC